MFALAFALVLGLTQCKKENTTTSNDEGAKVPVTLNVSGGNDSRVAVEGSTGVVTFEDGDVLYVASNGIYVGTMTYNGTVFSGEINEPTEGQKLQFYFLGNKTPEFNADNTSCSVVISDQTEYLPVISYAPSRENYQVGKTDYNATLLNKCALVKFDVTSVTPNLATCLTGRNNKVTVGFANNTFAYSKEGKGIITLPAGEGEKWVILLPQNEVVDTEANSSDGIWTGTCSCVPAIAENDYLTEGITVEITHPIGAINSLFTINANGDQVYFSQGNLQYIGSAATPYWKFAENQNGYLGSNGQGGTSQTVDRDLFGWGTSGYNHGANCYQPWSTSTSYSDYYAYGAYTNNLYDGNGQADWGYNAISNGGNTENSGWRTLTQSEWDYVFNTRNTTSGIRWAQGTVGGVNGTILLPDNWTADIYALNNTNGVNYNSNTITAGDWTNTLEANGAIFLPGAGRRQGTSTDAGMGSYGGYWSASYFNYKAANYVYFDDGRYVSVNHDRTRDYGFSVRLVHNMQ